MNKCVLKAAEPSHLCHVLKGKHSIVIIVTRVASKWEMTAPNEFVSSGFPGAGGDNSYKTC